MLIQILLVAISAVAIIKVIQRFRIGDISITWLTFWCLFWLAGAVIVILPNSTFYFARLVGVGRGADLIIYLSIALLFYLIFKLTIKIEKINRDITKIVRKIALEEKK